MRVFLSLIFLWTSISAYAQNDKVHNIVSEPARLMVCEVQPIAIKDKKKCSEQRLLRYITQNISYPEAAIADSIEGTVVVRFVVDTNGYVGEASLLKDIGGDCGQAALAVIDSIRADSIMFRPGVIDSNFVNSYVTLPIRFRIPEIFDYRVIDRDTIYTTLDSVTSFEGGALAFNMYVQQNLGYPRSGLDSCMVGDFGAELIIDSNGKAKILDLIDYNKMGIDFEFEVIRMINKMPNKWIPAIRKEKNVPSLYTTKVLFHPPTEQCKEAITKYDMAIDHSNKADELYASEDFEGSVTEYDKALKLVPSNLEYLFKRGLTYFELEKYDEACADVMEAKKHLLYTSIDALLPLLCKE